MFPKHANHAATSLKDNITVQVTAEGTTTAQTRVYSRPLKASQGLSRPLKASYLAMIQAKRVSLFASLNIAMPSDAPITSELIIKKAKMLCLVWLGKNAV